MRTRLAVVGLTALVALVVGALLAALGGPARPADASLEVGDFAPQVLIGKDDDNPANPAIQPAEAVNQSMDNADMVVGAGGNDVLIGLQGSDMLAGGFGNDILVGGPEGGSAFPRADLQFGEAGDDVALWAPGDGNDAFVGGDGRDALVFGVTDRDANRVPTLTGAARGFPRGIPTANVSGQGGFCTLERAEPASGYEWLVRFKSKTTGAFIVTMRVAGVEQVYCTSQTAAAITFADLTAAEPQFVEVAQEQVRALNEIVGAMVR
jgi:hypothetical protein